jgi:ribonucleoside-triphosphate reductase
MSVTNTGLSEIKKRDGRVVAFDRTKIVAAIMKSAQAVQGSDYRLAEDLADHVVRRAGAKATEGGVPTVEAVQDLIETVLIEQGHARTAKAFILYRARRSRIREGKSELMDAVGEILGATTQGAAKHTAIGAAASLEFYLNRVLPEPMAEAHLRGDWHIHALSHYDQTPHSAILPLRHLLAHGFASGHGSMRPPRRAATAAALTAAMLQAAQADVHGGVCLTSFDADLAAILPSDTSTEALNDAMEALVYTLNTAVVPGNGIPPRATIQLGLDASPLGREVARALLGAVTRGLGRGEPAPRPHVVFALREGVNLRPGDPNFDLTRQAAALAGAQPVITFLADDPGTAVIGHTGSLARTTLAPAGLALASRLSLNLPRLALRARREGIDLAQELDEALGLAATQLKHRVEAIASRPASEFPFLLAHGLPAGQAPAAEAPVGPLVRRAALGLNLVGLTETLMVLSGQAPGDSPSVQAEGLVLVKRAAARVARLCEEHDLRFLLQAVEAPEAAARFAKLDRREFGIIRGVTETTSYTAGMEGAYVPHLPGGCMGRGRPTGPLDADAVLAWLHRGLASGHTLLALDLPGGEDLGDA